jgi:hypothetical protein
MKLFTRFFLILLAFALMPVLITGVWLARFQLAARENARELHTQVSALFADTVEAFAADVNRSLGFAQELDQAGASRPLTGKAAGRPSDEFKILQREAAARSAFGLVSLLGPEDREYLRFADPQLFPGEYLDRSADPLIAHTRRTGHADWGAVALRGTVPFLPVAHPLADGRILYVEHSLTALRDKVRGRSVGKSGRIFMLGRDGRPLPGFDEAFPGVQWTPGTGPAAKASGWSDMVSTGQIGRAHV